MLLLFIPLSFSPMILVASHSVRFLNVNTARFGGYTVTKGLGWDIIYDFLGIWEWGGFTMGYDDGYGNDSREKLLVVESLAWASYG